MQRTSTVTSTQNNSGEIAAIATTPPPLAATLQNDFPEIKRAARVGRWWANFKEGTKIFEEKSIYAVDPSFLSLFSFPLVQGNAAQALLRPDAMLVTEQTAEKYFGNEWKTAGIIGKRLTAKAGKDEYTFTITGVLKNVPVQSTLQFDFLIPFTFLEKFDNAKEQWFYSSYYTYVQTANGTDAARLAEKVKTQIAKYRPGSEITLQLQPLTAIYLNSNFAFNSELSIVGNRTYVNVFIITGIIILLLACINFINLSTARSVPRSKEVGLRKTVGASRAQLVFQFLFEASFLCGTAVLLALLLVELAFPAFKMLYGKEIRLQYDPFRHRLRDPVLNHGAVGRFLPGIFSFFVSASAGIKRGFCRTQAAAVPPGADPYAVRHFCSNDYSSHCCGQPTAVPPHQRPGFRPFAPVVCAVESARHKKELPVV
jgi:putative ABC transport system permease protein